MNANGPFRRGEVVWGLDPFKEQTVDESDPERPFLVLSNETHPFVERQFAGVALSTTHRAEAVVLDADDWIAGGLPQQSYAYPWLLVTRDYADIASVLWAVTADYRKHRSRPARRLSLGAGQR